MVRNIINDRTFGDLSYHKDYLENTGFDGKQYLCRLPFVYVEIRGSGDVHVCCAQWNPVVIGNVLESSLDEIWRGDLARSVRKTIVDGSYRYCNHSTCPGIINRTLLDHNQTNLRDISLKFYSSKTPSSIYFAVDRSCNLACPSCRSGKIAQLDSVDGDRAYKVITRTLDSAFPEPHCEEKMLSMDGSGEIFSSQVYRKLLDTHDVFTKSYQWPNLRFRFTTNGTMMTQKMQDRYSHLFDRLVMINVSVDAGNRRSYEQVRVGGKWDLLWENLRYFHDTKLLENRHTGWAWNFILQKNNYESLPELIEIAKSFEIRPKIDVTNMLDWQVYSEDHFLQQAVYLPSHQEHQRYLDIMSLPEVQDYIQNHRFI